MSDPYTYSTVATPLPARLAGPAPAAAPAPAPRPAPTVRGGPRGIRALYDLARVDRDNYKQWAFVDGMSARHANSWQVRYTLRVRARYEVANNSYAQGIVSTLTNDTIGTGPRLQLLTPEPEFNRALEAAFSCWSKAIGLPQKLRELRQAQIVDGEGWALLTTNPAVDDPVQLDIRPIEADMVTTPFFNPINPFADDGMLFDEYYNPIEYHVLKFHPGDLVPRPLEYFRLAPRYVLHWYKSLRPQQYRGVPEIMPALDLFGKLRRFTQAVLAAAETAADFAAVLESSMPADDGSTDCEPFDSFDIDKRMMTTLPAGWKMNQFKPEQPSTTYEMFKRAIMSEIARCLNMPYNIAAGDYADDSYSSGRLAHQVYYRSITVDRHHFESRILDRIFTTWLQEAALVADLEIPGVGALPHRWLWDGHGHVDPEKEANAQATRLENLMTSFSEECYRAGIDPDVRAAEIAADRQRFTALGIPIPWDAPKPAAPASAPPETVSESTEPGKSPDD